MAGVSFFSIAVGPHPGPYRFSVRNYYVSGLCQCLIHCTLFDPHEDPMNFSSILPLDIGGSERLRNLFNVTVKKVKKDQNPGLLTSQALVPNPLVSLPSRIFHWEVLRDHKI